MAWSEIKKAVNSDLSTPLNEQILNALNSGKIIKHIQSGIWTGNGPSDNYTGEVALSISLSGFENVDKMVAFVQASLDTNTPYWDTTSGTRKAIKYDGRRGYVKSLSAYSLVIGNAGYSQWKSGGYGNSVSTGAGTYTVIEFY